MSGWGRDEENEEGREGEREWMWGWMCGWLDEWVGKWLDGRVSQWVSNVEDVTRGSSQSGPVRTRINVYFRSLGTPTCSKLITVMVGVYDRWLSRAWWPCMCENLKTPTVSAWVTGWWIKFLSFHCISGNVAFEKSATQSWTYLSHAASKAVDGGHNPVFEGSSCAHPGSYDTNLTAWWQVDLGTIYVVLSINITNIRHSFSSGINERECYVQFEGYIIWSIPSIFLTWDIGWFKPLP